jgi:Ca2+-binding RTX toxin-like protein
MRLRVLLFLVPAALVLLALGGAFTAANTVSASSIGKSVRAASANDVRPSACAGLTLAGAPIGGTATLTGTSGNDLILGSAGADTLKGGNGDDCLIGGGGSDTLNGGAGNDVCIAGAGATTYVNCEVQL